MHDESTVSCYSLRYRAELVSKICTDCLISMCTTYIYTDAYLYLNAFIYFGALLNNNLLCTIILARPTIPCVHLVMYNLSQSTNNFVHHTHNRVIHCNNVATLLQHCNYTVLQPCHNISF